MIYRFICPQCGKREEISMPASEYRPDGHICPCGSELRRDPKDFCTSYRACDGFYADFQSE